MTEMYDSTEVYSDEAHYIRETALRVLNGVAMDIGLASTESMVQEFKRHQAATRRQDKYKEIFPNFKVLSLYRGMVRGSWGHYLAASLRSLHMSYKLLDDNEERMEQLETVTRDMKSERLLPLHFTLNPEDQPVEDEKAADKISG